MAPPPAVSRLQLLAEMSHSRVKEGNAQNPASWKNRRAMRKYELVLERGC
jgi:hypothetical protein